MATATIAKSEMRKNENIVYGYGEVPTAIEEETGELLYGLPGGRSTKCPKEAMAYAVILDKNIRSRLKSVTQLMSVS